MRLKAWLVGLCALAVLGGGCEKQDVTKPKLDRDVTTVYTNLLTRRDALLGNPVRTDVGVEANCYRGGPKQADVGAGKDWRCDMVQTDASSAPEETSYLVIVRANGCWTALKEALSAKAETVDIITMTDPRTGADLADPLGGFDGCVKA